MEITIRPLKRSDAYTSYKWRNNPIIWKYTSNRPNMEITPEIELDWIEKVLARTDEKRYAILADNEYIGNIQLTNIENSSGVFHIFIGNPNYWGKGVAHEAINLLFDKCKKELNIDTINLNVHPENKRAIALYKKVGFIEIDYDANLVRIKMIRKI